MSNTVPGTIRAFVLFTVIAIVWLAPSATALFAIAEMAAATDADITQITTRARSAVLGGMAGTVFLAIIFCLAAFQHVKSITGHVLESRLDTDPRSLQPSAIPGADIIRKPPADWTTM